MAMTDRRNAREEAWNRLMQQLDTRQQTMSRLGLAEGRRRRRESELAQEGEAGRLAVSGASTGAALGPWGALVGGLLGKGYGAVKHGMRKGSILEGLGKFADPRGELEALAGSKAGARQGGTILSSIAGERARRATAREKAAKEKSDALKMTPAAPAYRSQEPDDLVYEEEEPFSFEYPEFSKSRASPYGRRLKYGGG